MRKIVFIFVAAVFLIAMGSTQGTAYKRPPNPVMNYVSQNVGIYDTYYGNFKEFDCRACHGDSNAVSNRHHYSAFAFADCPDGCPLSPPNCLTACHDPVYNPYTNPSRDCKECHVDGTWVPVDIGSGMGNLGYPHHRSDLAGSDQCTNCHQRNLLVSTYSVRTPYYYPTSNTHTPTPFHCENCHWPSGNAPHQPPSLVDWNSWIGLPKPTIWPDSLPHPTPLEASGPTTTGSVVPGDPDPDGNKPYRPMDGTHHEIQGNVWAECYLCHAGSSYLLNFETTNPLLIRYCENCHSRDSLHGIQEHVTAGHGLTIQQKCIACHGALPDTAPPTGVKLPTITNMSPRYGPQGTSCTITGKNFDTTSSIKNVLLTPKMGATDHTYIIPSGLCSWWSNDQIIFSMPSGLDARNYSVRVETDNGTSNLRVFTLTGTQPCVPCPAQTPVINSIEPPVGTDNATVIVHGQNFGDRHAGNRDVMLVGETYSIAGPIISWTNNEIRFRFPPWQFVPGTIQVKVQTESGESNQKDFELRSRSLDIASMDHPGAGILRLSGSVFGNSQQSVRPDGYGWASVVTFNSTDETIIVAPGNITSWSNTEIQLTLPAILFDSHGVTVETIYFFDSDGNGVYTSGLDTIHQTVTSDPQPFRPVECSLVPDATTIPRGGTLGFQGTVTNYTDKSATALFATKVTLPSGNKYPPSGYLIGPLNVSLSPYQSKSGHKSLPIPITAPLGTYTYHGYVGNYGAGLYHECTFIFTVTQ